MLGLYETIIRCQEYKKQWKNSKARHCSPSLTFITDITTSALPKKIGTNISKNQHFLFHLIPSYYILFLLFWGKKGISRNKTSFFLLMKQPSKHAMGHTFQRSCTLGCATHRHSSREPCERISCHS